MFAMPDIVPRGFTRLISWGRFVSGLNKRSRTRDVTRGSKSSNCAAARMHPLLAPAPRTERAGPRSWARCAHRAANQNPGDRSNAQLGPCEFAP